jgi:PncC family amidohydrolase
MKKMSSSNMKLATMESCTGGQLASDITSVSNASEILQESYVTYSNEAKIKLGVPKEVIEKYSVYSYETANEMAKAVFKFADVYVGIGVTGQLGRIDPNNPGISDNQVWYAIYVNGFCFSRKLFIIRDCTRAEKKKIITRDIIETLYGILN